MEKMREEFENIVIDRMRESGFLGIEVRVEMLGLAPDGSYLDETVNAWWDFWKASRAAQCVELPNWRDDGRGEAMYYESDITKALDTAGIRYT